MCSPAIIPVLASAAGAGAASYAGATTAGIVAAGVMGAASGASASANIQAAEYNTEVAKEQQKQLEGEAKNVRVAGSQESARALSEAEKVAARNRASFGAMGISGTTGTAAEVQQEVAQVGALESLTILNNANREAFGMEAQGRNLVGSAKSQEKAAWNKGYSTILTSAASGFGGFAA